MTIIPGQLAMVHRSDSRRYADGVHFLARIIREILILTLLYRRSLAQMKSGALHGLDYEQTRFASIAYFDTIVINIAKLIESRRDSWNFDQLYREWRRYEPDEDRQKKVLAAVASLRDKLHWLKDYRDENAAHQSKDKEITTLHALPSDIPSVADVVALMDMFVDGGIPYFLYLHESGDQVDLRSELGLPPC